MELLLTLVKWTCVFSYCSVSAAAFFACKGYAEKSDRYVHRVRIWLNVSVASLVVSLCISLAIGIARFAVWFVETLT